MSGKMRELGRFAKSVIIGLAAAFVCLLILCALDRPETELDVGFMNLRPEALTFLIVAVVINIVLHLKNSPQNQKAS